MSLSDYTIDKPKRRLTLGRKIWLVLGIVALASIGLVAAQNHDNTKSDTAKSESDTAKSLAERVQIEPTWTQDGPKLDNPGSSSCGVRLSTVCGTSRHSYSTDRKIGEADLRRIGEQAGWDLTIDDYCAVSSQESSPNPMKCTGTTKVGDFNITVSSSERPAGEYNLDIFVEDLRY